MHIASPIVQQASVTGLLAAAMHVSSLPQWTVAECRHALCWPQQRNRHKFLAAAGGAVAAVLGVLTLPGLTRRLCGLAGMICTKCSPLQVAQDAIFDARSICQREYASAPEVTVYGDPNFTFAYVPSHLHHMTFELVRARVRELWHGFRKEGRVRYLCSGPSSLCPMRCGSRRMIVQTEGHPPYQASPIMARVHLPSDAGAEGLHWCWAWWVCLSPCQSRLRARR